MLEVDGFCGDLQWKQPLPGLLPWSEMGFGLLLFFFICVLWSTLEREGDRESERETEREKDTSLFFQLLLVQVMSPLLRDCDPSDFDEKRENFNNRNHGHSEAQAHVAADVT